MRRKSQRRVTLRPKPWRKTLETARFYVNGEPVARGYHDAVEGIVWVVHYNLVELFDIAADRDGEILGTVSYGYDYEAIP